MALSQQDLDAFERGFHRVLQIVTRFRSSLGPRDQLVLALGLRSSHIEEALAHWELDRAQAHFEKLMEIARQLVEYDRTHPR